MENTSTSKGNNGEEIRVRKSYHTPQLISLGEIQAIIQTGSGMMNDGGNCATAAS